MNLDVVEYTQKVSTVGDEPTYAPLTFPSLPPLLMRQDQTVTVVTQVGRAVTWGGRMQAPAPIFDADDFVFLEKPKITYHRLEIPAIAWETTWEYMMAVDQATADAIDIVAAEAVPASPTVLT